MQRLKEREGFEMSELSYGIIASADWRGRVQRVFVKGDKEFKCY